MRVPPNTVATNLTGKRRTRRKVCAGCIALAGALLLAIVLFTPLAGALLLDPALSWVAGQYEPLAKRVIGRVFPAGGGGARDGQRAGCSVRRMAVTAPGKPATRGFMEPACRLITGSLVA